MAVYHNFAGRFQAINVGGTKGNEKIVRISYFFSCGTKGLSDFFQAGSAAAVRETSVVHETLVNIVSQHQIVLRKVSSFEQSMQYAGNGCGVVQNSEWIQHSVQLMVEELFPDTFRKAGAEKHDTILAVDLKIGRRYFYLSSENHRLNLYANLAINPIAQSRCVH